MFLIDQQTDLLNGCPLFQDHKLKSQHSKTTFLYNKWKCGV